MLIDSPCTILPTVSYLAEAGDFPLRFQWISDNVREALGYSPAEAAGREWWRQHVHPDDLEGVLTNLGCLKKCGSMTCQYRMRDQSGRYVRIQDEINLVTEAHATAGRIVGAWTVLAEAGGVEEELELTRQRYLSLVNSVDGVVWEADARSFAVSFISEQVERLLGYPRSDWMKAGFWESHIYVEDRTRTIEECRSCTLPGKPHHIEYRFMAGDQRMVWLHDMVNVICRDGHPAVLRGLMLDITQRKQAEAERSELLRREQRARAEAEAANTRKDHFLAVLSHELRTPLTPVLARLALLKREPGLSPRLQSALDMIRRNVELEARIIDDLLDLTKIVQGTLQLNYQRADAHQSVRDALEIYQSEIAARELKVAVDLGAAQHEVWADPTRLEQVFWNLISNAVKYTPRGGCIGIRSSNEGGRLKVQISDSGVGIDPPVMHRLFNAFEQGEQTLSRRFGGLGLGLSISKTIVDLHGGAISAFSPGKDKGSTFTIELRALEPAAERQAVPPPAAAAPKRGVKILLVEDNEDTQRVLARFLKLAGHQVRAVASVHAALAAAAADRFDLILCDIGLPDGTGWELMETLRKRQDIRGIALTGFASSEDAQRSREAGFSEHLAKPIIPEKLEAVIQQVTLQQH